MGKSRMGERNPNYIHGKSVKGYYEKIAGRPKPKHCEVCGRKAIIVFDHHHQTGKFRGWICSNCNCALGMVEDNPKILIALIKYIKEIIQ